MGFDAFFVALSGKAVKPGEHELDFFLGSGVGGVERDGEGAAGFEEREAGF